MNINEALIDQPKRGRGRPKGSKNKPKNGQEVQVKQKLSRSTTEKKIPEKITKKTNKKQTDTYFIIKPKTGGKCYYQSEITVDYTPYKEHECQEKVSIVPRLNTDNKPHIPGFIMDMDRGYYEKHDQRYREDHEAKISDYTKPKSRLYLPKPGKRHNYCCVCKQSYEDYLDHVSSNSHKKSYNNNEFSAYIKNISKDYEFNHRSNMKVQDQPDLQTDTLTQEEDDCQVLQLTDSSTQKFVNKISNEKPNKCNSSQYINNNVVYTNQVMKKAQSQITSDLKQAYLQKSVSSVIAKQGSTIDNNFERIIFNQNHSTQATCLGLSKQQTSSTNFQQQPQMYLTQGYYNLSVQPFPINSNEDNLMVPDGMPHMSNNNSHNNSLNNLSNNNNINQPIKPSYMKHQKLMQNASAINGINSASNNPTLNLKRRAEAYPGYNDALENTRKQFQISGAMASKQIIDLTEEGNDSQKPSVPAQNRIPSNFQLQIPTIFCKD